MASYGYPADPHAAHQQGQGGTVYYPAPDANGNAAAQAQAQAQADPSKAALDGSGAVDPNYAAYYAQQAQV